MPFINSKVELKVGWLRHCVLSVAGTDNDNANGNNDDNNIILMLKTQNCMFLLQLSQKKAIKNYQNFLVKNLKDQFSGINIKQKVIIKMQQTNLDFFLNQILQEPMDYFFRLLKSRCCFNKRFKAKRNYLPKGVIDNYNVIVNGKHFYDHSIDSDIKRYEEIR